MMPSLPPVFSDLSRKTPRFSRGFLLSITITLIVQLVGCASSPADTVQPAPGSSNLSPRPVASQPIVAPVDLPQAPTDTARKSEPYVSLGTGELVKAPRARAARPATDGAPISLNLENGDLRELIKDILEKTLQENVILHPSVSGTITVRTPKPLARSELIPTLEMLLRSANFALVRDGSFWKVLPAAEAVPGNLIPRVNARVLGPGNSVVILPVKYIGAKELERLIKPFAKQPEAAIRVDEVRNLLFLFGTENELRHLVDVAEMFDVDLLSGMSFVIYPLQSAEVKTVVQDWERIFPANANPLAGLVRLIPIERMNSLLVISPNPDVVKEAQRLIERLDSGNDAGGGARLYVYTLQYTQAEKLQAVLQQALSGRAQTAAQATVAPGQQQSVIGAPQSPIAGQSIVTPGNVAAAGTPRPTAANSAAAGQGQIGLARNATVIADKDRNALLIVATPSEYSAIESAIKKLDTAPKQVAIEVQIAEVTLDNSVSFGFAADFLKNPGSTLNQLSSNIGAGSNSASGFRYVWQGAGAAAGVKATLDTLQAKSQARTLASPVLVTLDNQKVTFTNGSQISVQTQQAAATTNTSAINSFQYINTGLTLTVTPRVSGNNVFLEIQQQNSSPGVAKGDNPNPPITQNSQSTNVMVTNGDTMLMGGLFTETGGVGSEGLPIVSTIPVLGALFGKQRWNNSRTEVVMLITPRILSTVEDTRDAVDELRRKMQNIEMLLPAVGTLDQPSSAEVKAARRAENLRLDAKPPTPAIPADFARSLRLDAGGVTQQKSSQ